MIATVPSESLIVAHLLMWFPGQTPADPARNLAARVHDPLSLPATKVTGHHRISMIRRDASTVPLACEEPRAALPAAMADKAASRCRTHPARGHAGNEFVRTQSPKSSDVGSPRRTRSWLHTG